MINIIKINQILIDKKNIDYNYNKIKRYRLFYIINSTLNIWEFITTHSNSIKSLYLCEFL